MKMLFEMCITYKFTYQPMGAFMSKQFFITLLIGELNFLRLIPYDYLHTLFKGIVEYTLGWTLQIVELVGRIDPDYKDGLTDLTNIIKLFPGYNSLHPTGRHTFFSDITDLMKGEDKSTKKKASTKSKQGVHKSSNITGHLLMKEVWKFTSALFQILFALPCGKLVPNDIAWSRKCGHRDQPFSVERVVTTCITAVIECVYYSNAKELTHSDLTLTYPKIIANAQCHTLLLNEMRLQLLNAVEVGMVRSSHSRKSSKSASKAMGLKSTTPTENLTQHHTSRGLVNTLKFHALSHFPSMKINHGTWKQSTDTELGERALGEIKGTYRKKNNRSHSTFEHQLMHSFSKTVALDNLCLEFGISLDESSDNIRRNATPTIYWEGIYYNFLVCNSKKRFTFRRHGLQQKMTRIFESKEDRKQVGYFHSYVIKEVCD